MLNKSGNCWTWEVSAVTVVDYIIDQVFDLIDWSELLQIFI